MYSILNKTGKKPNGVPFHLRNVGLRSIHIGSFYMLNALLMTISTLTGATYFVFEVDCFRFCKIKFVCIDVGMCDQVHDLHKLQFSGPHSYFRQDFQML